VSARLAPTSDKQYLRTWPNSIPRTFGAGHADDFGGDDVAGLELAVRVVVEVLGVLVKPLPVHRLVRPAEGFANQNTITDTKSAAKAKIGRV
jgi:hypothetical protein